MSGGPHRLTKNTGKAAAVRRGVHLQLAFGSHQDERWRIGDRWKRSEASPLQSLLIPIQGVLERLGVGKACGHHCNIRPGNPGKTLNVAAS